MENDKFQELILEKLEENNKFQGLVLEKFEENDKFQELVLEKLGMLTVSVDTLALNQEQIQEDVQNLKLDVTNVRQSQARIEHTLSEKTRQGDGSSV